MPGEIIAKDGDVIIKLDRKYIDGRDYNFLILVQTYKPDQVFNGPNSSEVNIPLVAGIVAGVIFFVVILAVICICCYRKHQHIKQGQGEYKVSLGEDQGNNSYSYSNEVLRNGNTSNMEFESAVSQKKLLSNRNDKNTPLIDSNKYVADEIVFKFDELHKSNEQSVKDNPDKHPKSPKSPILDALQNNPKFLKNFTQNETDADERANRISGFTSESIGSQSSVESPPPPLLPPAKKVSKSPKPLRHHASIRRAYRQSSSNDEIGSTSADEYDDKNIKLICDNTDPPSPSEVIPIKVTDPRVVESKPKHTLRPNRGKSLQDKRTQVKNKDAFVKNVQAPPQSGFQRSNSQCKLSAKSPRIGRSSRGSDGQDLDDFDSFSRPGTPTSVMSRANYRDEDTESYSPLRRTDSRQSLYASRSSLYGRKSRRVRRNSFGESVSTYAHDDLDTSMYSDFVDRPMSRKGYNRASRSMGDIFDREMREKETQTLRETATQTCKGRVSIAQPKKYVRNQSMRKKSASGVTGNNAKDVALKAKQNETKTKDKEITAKSFETQDTVVDANLPFIDPPTSFKTKSKPKPVPRKSFKGANQKDDTDSEKKNEVEKPVTSNPSSSMIQPQFIPPVLMQPYYHPSGSYIPNGYFTIQPGDICHSALPAQSPTHINTVSQAPTFQHTSGKSKSNWDLLCSITDAEKQRVPPPSDTTSVTGSVFNNMISSQPTPDQHAVYNLTCAPGFGGAYQQSLSQGYTASPNSVPSINGRFTPADASSGHFALFSPPNISDGNHGSPVHILQSSSSETNHENPLKLSEQKSSHTTNKQESVV
ncbi:hypothetical protein SNE40_014152 [Patella caerulea]|uniref:Uncharacterized protein n=1 Tax=Patella caerulea TaxID=87958 RepID=A0AAN8JJL8_PATCE